MNQMLPLIAILSLLTLSSAQYTNIAIIAMNDIHGTALPTLMQRQDNLQNYTYGGLQYMASLINIIKDEYPGHTLILDAGDQFQGGIESSPLISQGKIMNDFYDAIGLQGQAIGNHEFDFGPDFLLPYYNSKQD
jgi:5'-nucleotidase / UDP-sugar diphosphatase